MNRRQFLQSVAPLAAAPLVVPRLGFAQSTPAPAAAPALPPLPPLPPAGADGWISLMNGRNLDGFYTMLQRSGKGVAEKNGMVTFEDGLLHIMGNPVTDQPVENGYIATHQEFENYRVRVEYKWGMKRFLPHIDDKRDNGLLYHLVGEDVVWPTCVECQIEEGDVGDYFMVRGTRGIQRPEGPDGAFRTGRGRSGQGGAVAGAAACAQAGAGAGRGRSGPPLEPTGGRKLRDRGGDFEIQDGWNIVEVIAEGDRSTHILNGLIINRIQNLQQPDPQNPGQFIPLTRGKLAIELEYAEIWYRRFEIKSLA